RAADRQHAASRSQELLPGCGEKAKSQTIAGSLPSRRTPLMRERREESRNGWKLPTRRWNSLRRVAPVQLSDVIGSGVHQISQRFRETGRPCRERVFTWQNREGEGAQTLHVCVPPPHLFIPGFAWCFCPSEVFLSSALRSLTETLPFGAINRSGRQS